MCPYATARRDGSETDSTQYKVTISKSNVLESRTGSCGTNAWYKGQVKFTK
jgi:hypothetical protein